MVSSASACMIGARCSGRDAADVRRQHNAQYNKHRRLHSVDRRHVAVVSPSTSGRRWCVRARLRRVPSRHPAFTALQAGINGTAVDAR